MQEKLIKMRKSINKKGFNIMKSVNPKHIFEKMKMNKS